MCKYCEIEYDEYGNYDYIGDKLELSKNIDGSKQEFEVCIIDSPEDEGFVISIEGQTTELRIDINYCPICGRKL